MQLTLNPDTAPFNVDYTLRCGQVFRWERRDHSWRGVVKESLIDVIQHGHALTCTCFPPPQPGLIQRYFRLDDDLPYITQCINKDESIGTALSRLRGLRLIRQDPWECLISFICATFASIPRIKGMIHNLCQAFGQRIADTRPAVYTFPSPRQLASASISQLLACNLGYRARYVKAAASRVHQERLCLQQLQALPYPVAKQELLRVEGVGHKVADCVLLFSLDKLEAFPIDRWIHRVLTTHYQRYLSPTSLDRRSLTPRRYQELSAFGRSYFGEYAGYAQEYLYAHYSRWPGRPGSEAT